MKHIKKQALILLYCFTLFTLGTFAQSSEYSIHQARKVDHFLKRIAKAKKTTVFFRKGTFSESELNAYLNMIYTRKFAPEVKNIKLKLDVKNQVSGTAKVKLIGKRYESMPSFLRDFELEFAGKVESGKSRMRFLFEKLSVNGTSFSPEVLDEALATAQGSVDVKASIFDWFNFLPGIKKIAIDYKKVTFFY